MFQNMLFKRFVFFLIVISVLMGGYVAQRRMMFEMSEKHVDLSLSYRDLQYLSKLSGMSIEELLGTVKANTPVTSIALDEWTLQDLVDFGRVTLLQGSEIINLYRIGHINTYLLNNLYKQTTVEPHKQYLIIEKKADYEWVRDFLSVEFGMDHVHRIGRLNILEVLDDKQDLLEVGLGVPNEAIDLVKNNGFSAVIRLKNSKRINRDVVRQKFRNLNEQDEFKTLIFEGDTVLGYPSQLGLVGDVLKEFDYEIGSVEFFNQIGLKRLLAQRPERVVRVHSIPADELRAMPTDKAFKRYVRAVKERGVKIIFVHPYLEARQGVTLLDENVTFLNDLSKELQAMGYGVEARGVKEVSSYQSVTSFEGIVMSIGVFLLFLFLLDAFLVVGFQSFVIMTLVFLLSMYGFFLFGLVDYWNRLMALVVTVIIPTMAIILFFPSSFDEPKFRIRSLITYLSKLFFFTLAGATLVVGFLSHITYIKGINLFYGVKISFVLPLLFVSLFFFLHRHRMTSVYYVFKRLLYAPVRTMSLVAVLFCGVFVGLYILRSGNYLSFQIPYIEHSLREGLEGLLFIRPRTKEFLIGYPLLIIALLYTDRKISRDWLWFFNGLGVVAVISFMNSFCHIHTPLIVSLVRSAYGLIFGCIMAFLYVVVFQVIKRVFGRLTL